MLSLIDRRTYHNFLYSQYLYIRSYMDCKFDVMTLSVNKPIRNKTEFCLKKRCTPQMWYHAGLVYLYLATVVWAWRVTLRHRIKWWSLPVCNIFLLGFLSFQLERVIWLNNHIINKTAIDIVCSKKRIY